MTGVVLESDERWHKLINYQIVYIFKINYNQFLSIQPVNITAYNYQLQLLFLGLNHNPLFLDMVMVDKEFKSKV